MASDRQHATWLQYHRAGQQLVRESLARVRQWEQERQTQMTNDQRNDQRNDNLPVPIAAELDVAAIWKRTEEMDKAGVEEFPSFGVSTSLFSSMLVGVPFVFVSEPVFRTQSGGKFGPQDVGQAYVRLFDEHWNLEPARLVTFTGAYLLPRLHNATRNELIGSYVFTIWPNPFYKTKGNQPPLMLKRYKAGDMPPDVVQGDVWAGGNKPSVPNDGVAARIQEIESAGPVPPPWETQATGPSGHTRRGQK